MRNKKPSSETPRDPAAPSQLAEVFQMPTSFPLRLPTSLRQRAIELAEQEGISLNQFITLATVEKVARFDAIAERIPKGVRTGPQPPRRRPKKQP